MGLQPLPLKSNSRQKKNVEVGVAVWGFLLNWSCKARLRDRLPLCIHIRWACCLWWVQGKAYGTSTSLGEGPLASLCYESTWVVYVSRTRLGINHKRTFCIGSWNFLRFLENSWLHNLSNELRKLKKDIVGLWDEEGWQRHDQLCGLNVLLVWRGDAPLASPRIDQFHCLLRMMFIFQESKSHVFLDLPNGCEYCHGKGSFICCQEKRTGNLPSGHLPEEDK